jgi:hypothetical protein
MNHDRLVGELRVGAAASGSIRTVLESTARSPMAFSMKTLVVA